MSACFLGSVDKIDIAAVRGRQWSIVMGSAKETQNTFIFIGFHCSKRRVAITSWATGTQD
jgi:hypothetical protein